MAMTFKKRSRGACGLEFTLVGIPLIFVLIGIFEMCRGMWQYHTLAYAVKEGSRYAVVHGQGCSIPPNSCNVTVSQIARMIRTAGVGLPPDSVTLTFKSSGGATITCSLPSCDTAYAVGAWPPATSNAPGQPIEISGVYQFHSAMAMFWPGNPGSSGSPSIVNLAADARESMQF
jgi:hypothetical protein